MNKRYLNGLCSILSLYIEDGVDTVYENFANYMMNKIKRYGRKYQDQYGKDKLVVHLYNNEAELLLQMMAICLTASIGEKENYYEQVGVDREAERKRNLEQKLNDVFS